MALWHLLLLLLLLLRASLAGSGRAQTFPAGGAKDSKVVAVSVLGGFAAGLALGAACAGGGLGDRRVAGPEQHCAPHEVEAW